MNDVKRFLADTGNKILPRILSQISRDPGAPFYGACDRNWWHYKVRDFSSVILQQAGYTIACAAELNGDCAHSSKLRELAAATAGFWNRRAILHGAFEEYYPYEQGYPPVAFSSLAVAKLCRQGIVPLAGIRPGLEIAVRQLLSRFEAGAANQQIAGTAALAVIRTLDASLVRECDFQSILTRTFDLQHQEGWFPEYDGPDLGYLSVSIDCLWDIFDETQDPRSLQAIRRAAEYTAWFILNPLGAAGMHNSRNTDYLVPYGLVRLALEDFPAAGETAMMVRKLFTRKATNDFHPFDAVDDRYWCHYIGHSVFRALRLLEIQKFKVIAPDRCVPSRPSLGSSKPGSGHTLLYSPAGACSMISPRKGAVTTAVWPDGATASDFGWIVQHSRQLFVSHWWSPRWLIHTSAESAGCEGYLVSHREHLSTPWKHMLLRPSSFFLGRRMIRLLKRLVIFKKSQQDLHFSRSVSWAGEILVIKDKITGVSRVNQITRAPRASKRHVASADSFHPEDFKTLEGVARKEEIERTADAFMCVTKYGNPESSPLAL